MHPWSVGIDLGYGRLALNSDQSAGAPAGTFALAFRGTRTLNELLSVSVEVGGWLLQAFNLKGLSVGEGVSTALLRVAVYPLRNAAWFIPLSAGWGSYTNNRPLRWNGDGWTWKVGMGFEIDNGSNLTTVLATHCAAGRFGDVRNAAVTLTGRRYSVWDIQVGVQWHFGRTTR